MDQRFDVVIIGAGASGLPAAYSFLEAGFKVCCVEQGDSFTNLTKLSDGGELDRFGKLSYDINHHSDFSSYSLDSSDSVIHPAFYHGVGGSTLLYSCQFPRFHRSDLKTYSTDGVGRDWPISYDSLLPFYQLNETLTGVAGVSGDPMYPDWNGPFLPPVPLGQLGLQLKSGFQKLGWHYWPSYASLNSVSYNGRPKDTFSRPTNLGDITGSKGSVDNTYLPSCISKGLVLYKNTKVLKISASSNSVSSISCVDNNNRHFTLDAPVFILCAGGIGSPRLLLSSANANHTLGLCNSSGLVGKNLMLHPLGYAEGYFHEDLTSNFGPQGCCLISQEFYNTKPSHNFKRGYTIQSLRGPLPIEASINFFNRRLLKLGPTFWSDFSTLYNHTAHLTVICEDFPEVTNYISLDRNSPDRHGVPGVKVHYQLSNNSKNMLSHGINSLRKLLKASGAYKTFGFGPVKNTGWHIHGTCIMGNDPQTSVVDANGKCHDMDNLYIFDSSIFPSSSGVNPASTVQALSLLLSSKLINTLKHA